MIMKMIQRMTRKYQWQKVYSDMLENESDWVDLYTKSLTSSHVRVIGIIDVAFDVEFVV